MTLHIPRMRSGGTTRIDTRRIRGRVLRAADGRAVEGARVWITSVQPQPRGNLEIWQGGTMTTGPDGSYELAVPDVPRYRVQVYAADGGKSVLTEEWAGTPGLDEERDLAIP